MKDVTSQFRGGVDEFASLFPAPDRASVKHMTRFYEFPSLRGVQDQRRLLNAHAIVNAEERIIFRQNKGIIKPVTIALGEEIRLDSQDNYAWPMELTDQDGVAAGGYIIYWKPQEKIEDPYAVDILTQICLGEASESWGVIFELPLPEVMEKVQWLNIREPRLEITGLDQRGTAPEKDWSYDPSQGFVRDMEEERGLGEGLGGVA